MTATLQAVLSTNKGDIRINLFSDDAPNTVANFVNLISNGFYDGLSFHRVIDNFMVQGGCPQGTGMGGPGYNFADEFVDDRRHDTGGVLSMANSGPGTNGSQFFITHLETPWLDGKHTVFGKVVGEDDMAVVNKIEQGDQIEKATVEGDASKLLADCGDNVQKWNDALKN